MKHWEYYWLFRDRPVAFQIHGTILTVRYFMSVSFMCRHVDSQVRFGVESFLTDMTSFVSDVQMDRVLVSYQIRARLCTEFASRVDACK